MNKEELQKMIDDLIEYKVTIRSEVDVRNEKHGKIERAVITEKDSKGKVIREFINETEFMYLIDKSELEMKILKHFGEI